LLSAERGNRGRGVCWCHASIPSRIDASAPSTRRAGSWKGNIEPEVRIVRIQLRLRTLMLAIAVVALVLGVHSAWRRSQQTSPGWPPDLIMTGVRSFDPDLYAEDDKDEAPDLIMTGVRSFDPPSGR
jgi:hypothetical protein